MNNKLRKILHSQLRKNMFSGVIRSTANTIVGFIVFPVYLHFLGAKTYGLWLLLAVIIEFARLGMLGIPETMIKLVAEDSNKNSEQTSKITSSAISIICLCGIIVIAIIILFNSAIVQLLGIEPIQQVQTKQYLVVIAALSFYVFIAEIVNSILSGLGRMDQANYIKSCSRLSTPIVAIGFLYLGFGLKSLFIGNFVSCIIIHFWSLLYIKRTSSVILLPFIHWDKKAAKKILMFGGGISTMSLLNMFIIPFNKVILSRYVGLEAIPVFEIGCRVTNQLRSVFHISLSALMPEVSKKIALSTGADIQNIKNNTYRTVKFIFYLGFPLYLLLFIVATPLLKIWLGDSFTVTMPVVLRILLLSSFIILTSVPFYFTLLGMGKVKLCLYASFTQALVNVLGICICIFINIPLSEIVISKVMAFSLTIGSTILITQGIINIKRLSVKTNGMYTHGI